MAKSQLNETLLERFGDPIGSYAGEPLMGVRDEQGDSVCEDCGMMKIEGEGCGCSDLDEAKKKGLWANIHARRKAGKRPKRPGEKGYPKTLDIEK